MIEKAEIERLTPEEKIQLVEDIWDSLAAKPELVPITEVEKAELDKRWAEHQANPDSAVSLDEFRRRLDEKL